MQKLTKIQQDYVKLPCENCGGVWRIVNYQDPEETVLVCNGCDCVIDSDGGMIT